MFPMTRKLIHVSLDSASFTSEMENAPVAVKRDAFTSATATLIDAGTQKNVDDLFNGESLSFIHNDFLLCIFIT